jgi:asparagine synthase (glutamine-hydrolysing)
MCGICGVIQVGGEPRTVVESHVLDRMTDAMAHRGPNDRGMYEAPGIAIGARRLSIVDVEGGHQPFRNEDGTIWAAQNGELYTHDALREELRRDGHRFRSRCDTEILPHLYERNGLAFPELLRGKFAVIVWDGRERRAVLARDRMGIKPLYYAAVGDLVVFGSELKSVLASGLVDTSLDYDAIDAYLTLSFFPAGATPLAAVSKLPPGHRLIVDRFGARSEPYWEFPRPLDSEPSGDEEEHAVRLLEALDESVRLRLMSDVPLGAMLSGGLDSSLVVALMARHMSEPVKTFSVGFREAGDANELADARFVANTFGTDHHELELSLEDEQLDLEELVWFLDEPLADLGSVGFLALSGLAARHVTVALSGQGADELLGGYRRHRNAAFAERWRRLPNVVRHPALAAARRGPSRFRHAAQLVREDDPASFYVIGRRNLDEDLRRRLGNGPLAGRDGSAAVRATRALATGLPTQRTLANQLYLDARLALVDDMLQYFDRASMAHSLEVRVPFLDHEVVELCARIPSELKVKGTTTKYLLKRVARGIVPDRIIDKPKIGFFYDAVDAWFDTQAARPMADYLLAPDPRFSAFLNRDVVEELVRQHRERRPSRGNLLLPILILEVWLRTYLPRALAQPRFARERVTVPG